MKINGTTAKGLLPCVEVETNPTPTPTATVIWLHGLGADGHDFEPIVPELGLPFGAAIRFIFPHAPMRPVTINGGAVMRAWYDIMPAAGGFADKEDDIRESGDLIRVLIEKEIERGVDAGCIVLAGFSQGGAVALHTGLRFNRKLAGILALSTYLPLADAAKAETTNINRHIPIFLAHGRDDPLVPLKRGLMARRQLEDLGAHVEWHDYPMGHSVIPAEIHDLSRYLTRVLALSTEV